jgi:chitin disaccharide deacetylase
MVCGAVYTQDPANAGSKSVSTQRTQRTQRTLSTLSTLKKKGFGSKPRPPPFLSILCVLCVLCVEDPDPRACKVAVLEGAVEFRSESIRLVVNADGFGLSATRTQGILAAHRKGIVTSTSVLGNAIDPEAIKRDLEQTPGLGVGVLLSLEDGVPVARPETVPSLLDGTGRFPSREREILLNWAKVAMQPAHIEAEFDAQVARLRDLGLGIDHLCVRGSVGFLPVVARAMESVARRHGIAGLRTAVERPTLAWTADVPRGLATAALGAMAWYTRRQLGARRHGPQSWGYFERGRLDEIRILEILGRLGPGSHEIICQPDLDPASQEPPARGEVTALTSTRVREALTSRHIELCRWSDLF